MISILTNIIAAFIIKIKLYVTTLQATHGIWDKLKREVSAYRRRSRFNSRAPLIDNAKIFRKVDTTQFYPNRPVVCQLVLRILLKNTTSKYIQVMYCHFLQVFYPSSHSDASKNLFSLNKSIDEIENVNCI